jgi:hypothetical protein
VRARTGSRRRSPLTARRVLGGAAAVIVLSGVLAVQAVGLTPTPPTAPRTPSAASGNTKATISWVAPASNNGSAVTGYIVTPYLAGVALTPRTYNSTATSQTVSSLTNGKSYTFRVAAKNAKGTGPKSVPTAALTVGLPTAPRTPSAVAGNAKATVTWVAPALNNGSAITSYIVTPYLAGAAQTASTLNSTATSQTVSSLTNGKSYTFRVAAKNARGTGPKSVATAAVTPAAVVTSPVTLPPGAALPSDAECAARVVAAPEVRAGNAVPNQTRGHQKNIAEKWLSRVTGDFAGTTDEILQWGACKWGIDSNIVRAQAALESYWKMNTLGDFGTDAAACPPDHGLGVDGTPGQCPQSYGILQVRYPYHGPPAGRPTWPEAATSTAYNVDYAYAQWRSCFEGDQGWLNTVDRGATYAAGDAWGCVGLWYAGRWHTAAANDYITRVQAYFDQQIWKTASFINAS